MSYPRGDDVDVLAGLSFPDPFRALENGDDPAVLAWQRAQAERADAYTDALPGYMWLHDRVAAYAVEKTAAIPRFAGRWFRTDGGRVLVADEPMGPGKVAFETADHPDQDGRVPFLSWYSPAPGGTLLAVGLCYDGSEANTIRVADPATGQLLDDRPPQVLMDNWTGGVHWLPDGSGFFFVAPHGAGDAFALRVFRHDVGRPARTEPEAVPLLPVSGLDYVAVFVAREGRYAVAAQGLVRPKPVAVLDLSASDSVWRPFVTAVDASVAGHLVGDEYVAVTDHRAARGRVVAIPLASGNDMASWRTVVPESDAVLRYVTPVGETLYVSELVDTYARVRVVDLAGTELGRVPLPGNGALSEPSFPLTTGTPTGHPDEFLFGFSSLTESWGVYRHRPGDTLLETLAEPRVRLDAVVDDLWAVSADGTRVPYHAVYRPDVDPTVPRPTLVFAYGGYNVPHVPRFPRAMAAFVEAGGVLVHGHIRGGAEFGIDWWHGGRMRDKANCYADVIAIAEDLIARGRTTRHQLALTGGSNGGHMAGAALTMRPDLWRAVVPRVPILDLIGACRHPYGRAAVAEELADPDDLDDVSALAAISPYHLIEDGIAYPAVYLDAGATDTRCPPWHARKFAARLQEATTSGRPVLLRVWDDVGHGWATPADVEVVEHTAWIAFVLDQLGLPLDPEGSR